MKQATVGRLLLGALSVAGLAVSASAQSPTSVYTALGGKSCKTVQLDKVAGSSTSVCPGIAGFRLQVEDDDARMSVTIIDAKGKKHPLNYWQVITTAFSTVGDKAEWRVVKKAGKITPLALIVRVTANENPDDPQKTTSYLAVAKITRQSVCVVDKIKPGAAQNEEARAAADAAATRPCLQN